jgi:hypothetical protein
MGITGVRRIAASHPDCPVCQKRIAYQRALVARWKGAGLCRGCGKPCVRFKRCADCRKRYSGWHSKQQHKTKARQKSA